VSVDLCLQHHDRDAERRGFSVTAETSSVCLKTACQIIVLRMPSKLEVWFFNVKIHLINYTGQLEHVYWVWPSYVFPFLNYKSVLAEGRMKCCAEHPHPYAGSRPCKLPIRYRIALRAASLQVQRMHCRRAIKSSSIDESTRPACVSYCDYANEFYTILYRTSTFEFCSFTYRCIVLYLDLAVVSWI